MSLPPIISLEEHFFTTPLPPSLLSFYSAQLKSIPSLLQKLTDLSSLNRIPSMNTNGISLQIISHAPGLSSFPASYSIQANNQLSSAIKSFPKKFAGFAVLPMSDTVSSALELERAIKELGLVGALIDSHTAKGKFYDGEEYLGFWEKVQELDVPVYLHPTWSSLSTQTLYKGNFSSGAEKSLASSGFGWHFETGLSFLRLFASGLFDRFPRLKIILGHFGEMIPFMLQRICSLSKRWGEFERGFKTVWDENVWISTSGCWSVDPLRCILSGKGNTRIEKVLFGVDYPFQGNEEGIEFLKELRESGILDEEGFRGICFGNVERMLGRKLLVERRMLGKGKL
ncbi:hypothetical protein QBC38DRAFT_475757 [Podospora fimiseda]|uniref:Amidohydrolase-related domain-containing protein n=1 Tax=Podospora fimiseda TaxID=252190 RepID=A0AAN7BRF0_9PEZI|nr:hypothetical protein QBC38DRAFT_475757 [Podospora fimiseda]